MLADIWTLETIPEPEVFRAAETSLRQKLNRIDAALSERPFFDGSRFRLVDAVWAPVFRYFDALERLAGLTPAKGYAKLSTWRRALARRPSVRRAVGAEYPARLEAFLRRQPSHLSQLITRIKNAA